MLNFWQSCNGDFHSIGVITYDKHVIDVDKIINEGVFMVVNEEWGVNFTYNKA